MSSYERKRLRRAHSDARTFWNVHQILSTIMPGLIGIVSFFVKQVASGQSISLADPKTELLALAYVIAALGASWLLSFAGQDTVTSTSRMFEFTVERTIHLAIQISVSPFQP